LQIEYDPSKITYQALLETFWKNIEPYDGAGQFCDKGTQYQSAIFYANEAEKAAYLKSI
jgi:peptide-methionine (S)-S-oxide reductase